MKPRVMSLVVFTALVGLDDCAGTYASGARVHGAALHRGRCGRRRRAQHVVRRRRRRDDVAYVGPADPAAGASHPARRWRSGSCSAVFSIAVLGVLVSWLAAAIARLHHLLLHLHLYGVAQACDAAEYRDRRRGGAFPPMIGWAAATGTITIEPILLFLIVFFWTPPHFWALSLLRADDYARARIPMLPVVAGPEETRRQILIYCGRALARSGRRRGCSATSVRSTA